MDKILESILEKLGWTFSCCNFGGGGFNCSNDYTYMRTIFITLGSVAATLIVGGVISGIQSKKVGKGLWNGFANYLNDNWA